jgi:hypothetical protein
MARVSRPFVVAVVLTALLLTASACGAVDSRTEVVRLRSANPLTSDLYVRMRGPAGAVHYIAQGLIRGAFGSQAEGFFVPPDVRRQKTCSFSHTISSLDSPQLQAWRGRKMKITVYGNSSYAATYCQGIQVSGIFQSRS